MNCVWSPPLFFFFFFCPSSCLYALFLETLMKADLCQISCQRCRKEAYRLVWSFCITFQQLYLMSPASHVVPHFSPQPPPPPILPSSQLFTRMWIFLPFEINKSSVIKLWCLWCWCLTTAASHGLYQQRRWFRGNDTGVHISSFLLTSINPLSIILVLLWSRGSGFNLNGHSTILMWHKSLWYC